MPVRRIKCLCGQEHVLRVGEWVYALRGLVVLSILLNVGTVLLLVVLFNERQDSSDRGTVLLEDGVAQQDPVAQESSESVHGESDSAVLVAGVSENAFDRAVSPGGPPQDAASPTSAAMPRPGPDRSADREDEPRTQPTGDRDLVSVEDVTSESSLREMLEERTSAPASVERQAESAAADDRRFGAQETPAPLITNFRAVAEMSTLQRFLLATADWKTGSVDALEVARSTELLAALIHDPDALVRHAAMDRLATQLEAQASPEVPPALRPWLDAAAEWIRAEPAGERLRRWLDDAAGVVSQDQLRWDAVSQLARPSDREVQGFVALHDAATADPAVDVVLVIDVTESMADAFSRLRQGARWLLSAIRWAIPGARTGLLFYRDDVAHVSGFGATTDEQVAIFGRQEARGGGDVPEGVFGAIRSAFELGRFPWRADARKVLIVIGDAPPRFEEIRATLSLVRMARREADYRLHILVPSVADSDPSVTFFEDLAAAGAGRLASVSPDNLSCSVLQVLFPRQCAGLVARACVELQRR